MNPQRSIILYIAASLDGYIARPDGSLDWLPPIESDDDFDYGAFYASIDTIVMGNATYAAVKTMGAEFPYRGKQCYVFSRQHAGERDEHVEYVADDPVTFVAHLREQPGAKIWLMGGSELLADFLRADLVDEFVIAVIPILLGGGIPLFRPGGPELKVRLVDNLRYDEVVLLHYVRA